MLNIGRLGIDGADYYLAHRRVRCRGLLHRLK